MEKMMDLSIWVFVIFQKIREKGVGFISLTGLE